LGDVDEFNVGAVTDSNAAANSVVENAANGTVVNITGLATDADATTNTITYSLFDNDGGNFAIDANTGVVTTAAAFNREGLGPSRNITIRATSADTSFTDQVFSIAIVDANEFAVTAPTDVNATANAVDENVSIGTIVGITASASDADATTNTVTYSLFDSDGGNFAIDANTGMVTTAASLDREALGPSRNIIIRATSLDGSTADTAFTIAIDDLDEFDVGAVTDSNATANTMAENSANGTLVNVTGFATDADATTNSITYSLFDNDSGRFAINSSSGVVTVDGAINREAVGASRNITIRATSADGSFSDQTFSIGIVDANEFSVTAPVDTNATANAVAENAANGTSVGITAFAIDADSTSNSITFTLADNDGGRFNIDPNTGVVSVVGGIDREADGPSRIITVRATSADGSFSEESYLINVYDVDEFDVASIGDLSSAPNAVAENSGLGTVVPYQAFSFDADATINRVVYSLDDDADGRFAIDAITGMVTVADAFGLNYEAKSSHNIVVRAMSDDGSASISTITITVLNVAERPIGFSEHYSTSYIDVLRQLAAGVLANDLDPDGDTLSVQLLSGPDSGLLAISSNGGFDYTPPAGFVGQVSFMYQAFDGALASDPIEVTIDVLLPTNVGTGGFGGSGSGESGSGSTPLPTDNTSAAVAPAVVPIEAFLPPKSPATARTEIEKPEGERQEESVQFGLIEKRESRRVGELNAAVSRRVSRIHVEQWSTHRASEESEALRKREEFVLPSSILTDEKQNRDDNSDQSAISFTMGTVVTTVLGTGVILWVVQATQLAATFITAAAPTWIHVDIASSLNNLMKERNASDEASAKLFE
ncbi:MAG TPA: cadherin domain-containing protein, partial [Pirellula sp.]|nr:cadherin domain-containing protein [Pirellula sp.]